MPGDDQVASRVRAQQWRQGHVLSAEFVEMLRGRRIHRWLASLLGFQLAKYPLCAISNKSALDWFAITSHDCDINSTRIENEPTVEVLQFKLASKSDGNLAFGKSIRKYEIVIQSGGKPVVLHASIHDRFSVPRHYLGDYAPDSTRRISEPEVKGIAQWIAKRYVRSAFPDHFNDRTKPASEKIRAVAKKNGRLLTGIYVRLNVKDDLPQGQNYEVDLWGTVDDATADDKKRWEEATKLLGVIEAELEKCEGVEISSAELRAEREFSLTELKQMDRWDYDYLSLRDGDNEHLLPPL